MNVKMREVWKGIPDGSYMFRVARPEPDGTISVSYKVTLIIGGSEVFVVPEYATHYIHLDRIEESLV